MSKRSPFLFVIGVEKSGTTSLFRAMQSLPEFNLTRKKEAGFFRTQYERGIAHFESLFTDSFQAERYNTDITPLYHRFPKVMRRIERFDADKRILILLRNPVKRAFSHYIHDITNHVAKGERTDSFKEAVTFSFVDLWEKRSDYFLRYYPIVTDAFERFGAENCHVLFFEDMVEDWSLAASRLDSFFGFPDPVLRSVSLPHDNRKAPVPFFFSYGLQPDGGHWLAQKTTRQVILFEKLTARQVRNAFATQGSYTLAVPESLVAEMVAWTEADTASLELLLGIDLGAWKVPFAIQHAFAEVEKGDLEFVRERIGDILEGATYAGFGLRRL